jgi:hypothetical protein
MRPVLETRIVAAARPARASPGQVAREFRGLVESGVAICAAGRARRHPGRLLSLGYTPKHRFELFDATFYLTHLRYDEDIGFFVAYVRLRDEPRVLHPRIFYKDVSLVWRSASHCVRTGGETWIGKGDLKTVYEGGEEVTYGAEETTNLPIEAQTALDRTSRLGPGARRDDRAVPLVLRNAPASRIAPYADFTRPRGRAMADPRNRVNGGRPIARFARPGDPSSLRFAKGFEPDFGRGVLEVDRLRSRMYGGRIRKYRILSRNRRIQYQFIAGPKQVWIVPPQALTTELSSYGVRTVDVEAPEDLCVPGYEYHYLDDGALHTQIPGGFAGAQSEIDPSRADASPWLDRLPVVREFRRRLLGGRR